MLCDWSAKFWLSKHIEITVKHLPADLFFLPRQQCHSAYNKTAHYLTSGGSNYIRHVSTRRKERGKTCQLFLWCQVTLLLPSFWRNRIPWSLLSHCIKKAKVFIIIPGLGHTTHINTSASSATQAHIFSLSLSLTHPHTQAYSSSHTSFHEHTHLQTHTHTHTHTCTHTHTRTLRTHVTPSARASSVLVVSFPSPPPSSLLPPRFSTPPTDIHTHTHTHTTGRSSHRTYIAQSCPDQPGGTIVCARAAL